MLSVALLGVMCPKCGARLSYCDKGANMACLNLKCEDRLVRYKSVSIELIPSDATARHDFQMVGVLPDTTNSSELLTAQ